MTHYLFLDDERMPRDVTWVVLPFVSWSIVRNFDEFRNHILEYGVPKYVAFDHDLADTHYQVMQQEYAHSQKYEHDDGDMKKTFDYGPEKTGFDCAKWLVDFCHSTEQKFPAFNVHSLNPVGKERIFKYIDNALASDYIEGGNE